MYKVESTIDQAKVVEDYFNLLLDQGNNMNDIQVEKLNLLEV